MNVFRINPADLTLRNASLAAPLSQQHLVQALAAKAEKFVVKDKYGPLREGELERARQWGKELARDAAR